MTRIAIFVLVLSLFMTPLNGQTMDTIDFQKLRSELIADFQKDFEFSVLIEYENQIVFEEYFGYRSNGINSPIESQTLFNVASITKSVTAVGIFKLIEQEKLYLTDSISKLFANSPEKLQSITIHHLLSHTSGLPQNYPLSGISNSVEALEIIFENDLNFEPGNGFRYSNQNYQLLALIIEHITGNTYEEYIRNEVFQPLGMTNTKFWHEVDTSSNTADLGDQISSLLGTRNWGFNGGVGLFSTVTDLSKFWSGIQNPEYLTEDSFELFFGNYYQTSAGTQVGYGFFTYPETDWDTPERWTRGTESFGHNAAISHFPEKNLTIIVTTNSGEINGDPSMTGNRIISDKVAEFFFD